VDDHLVAVEPAHHVEIHHRDGVGQGHSGVGGVVAAAEQAPLLAGKGGEQNAAGQRRAGRQPAGHLHQQRRAAGVVVGPVVHRLFARGRRVHPAIAEVVVVGPQDHGLPRIDRRAVGPCLAAAARQQPENVAALGLHPLDRGAAPDPPAGQRGRLRLERFVDRPLNLGERAAQRCLDDLVEPGAGEVQHRHRPPVGTLAGPGERHQRITPLVGVVAEHEPAGLVLRGVGRLAGKRRVLRGLIALEGAVGIVLLRLLPEHHHGLALGPALVSQRGVVVVVLGRRRDPVAGKGQWQVELAAAADGQRREILAQLQRHHRAVARGIGRPDELRSILGRWPELGLERHLEGLRLLLAPRRRLEPEVGEPPDHPVGRRLDAGGAGAAAFPFGRGQP